MAATLGKTSIGKLNRRNVLKADIGKLCELVAEPAEPLALRLSSNLLVGVVRVYKVKHDIFVSEVTTCFTSLKRTLVEISAAETSAALNMSLGSVRPDTITLVAPEGGIGMNIDLDMGGPIWEDFLAPFAGRDRHSSPPGITSQDFGGTGIQTQSQRPPHTLHEAHVDVLAGAEYGLGEFVDAIDLGQDLDLGELDLGLQDAFGDPMPLDDPNLMDVDSPTRQKQKPKLKSAYGGDSEAGVEPVYARKPSVPIDPLNMADWAPIGIEPSSPGFDPPGSGAPGLSSSRPGSRFQSREPQPEPVGDDRLAVAPLEGGEQEGAQKPDAPPAAPKKPKKPKGVLQDARTELREDEMAADNYANCQKRIRVELELRRQERDAARVIDVWMEGVPHGFNCPALDDWFKESFKALVDGNSNRRKRDENDSFAAPLLPPKRRREETPSQGPEMGRRMETPMNFGVGIPRGSSVEAPERGLRGSQAGDDLNASQRSAFFPWDAPIVSSSTNGDAGLVNLPGPEGHPLKVDQVTTPSRLSASPSKFGPGLDGFGDGFEFPATADERPSQVEVTMERNSFKFLEYVRMQERALADPSEGVQFSSIAPVESSTTHVAAAAFYHTLVLATKSAVRVKQLEPFADFSIQAL
ncbi:cohesin subunit rad21 [Ceratobasidium sp. AG-Ba]|nr:cohesin subunit rad21 [Ceratobasidium sp. AG-Ba]